MEKQLPQKKSSQQQFLCAFSLIYTAELIGYLKKNCQQQFLCLIYTCRARTHWWRYQGMNAHSWEKRIEYVGEQQNDGNKP